jgi:hypothetical protein
MIDWRCRSTGTQVRIEGATMNRMTMGIAAAALFGGISGAALADAEDQAILKVYKLAAPGREATAADLRPESLVLQKAEVIEPAEEVTAASAQSFNLENARYSYSVSYTPASGYESSSVKLVVESGGGHAAKKASYDLILQSGQTKIVTVGGYAIALSMEPAVDEASGI